MSKPGVVLVWSGDRPVTQTFLVEGEHLILGRQLSPGDDRVSTQHTKVFPRPKDRPYYEHYDDFVLTDLNSRNGTFANGEKVAFQKVVKDRAVLRTGRTVWVALLDVDARVDEPVPFSELPLVLVDVARETVPDLAIHATAIERCLLSAWDSREHFVTTVKAAARACLAAERAQLRGSAFDAVRLRNPIRPFAALFEHVFGVPPPFAIPDPYVMNAKLEIDGVPYESMITTKGTEAIVVQAHVGAIGAAPAGSFQAGFWGHGVNSYAVYYSRVTDKYRLFLRLPYGEGVYCADPKAERAEALATLAKYSTLVETLPARFIEIVESMGEGYYRIERLDGSVVESDRNNRFFALAGVDFEALVR
jgi:hypothetical protein